MADGEMLINIRENKDERLAAGDDVVAVFKPSSGLRQ